MSKDTAKTDLTEKRCLPCEGGMPSLSSAEIERYRTQIGGIWSLAENGAAISRSINFPSFQDAMRFVNALADLAEEEGHHPDFCVAYKRVRLSLSTHAISGLAENDFALAAKTNQLLSTLEETE